MQQKKPQRIFFEAFEFMFSAYLKACNPVIS